MSEAEWRKRALFAEDFIRCKGYTPCDMAACNCGSWHGGNAKMRLDETTAVLEDMLAGWRYIQNHYGDLHGIEWAHCEKDAARVLGEQ